MKWVKRNRKNIGQESRAVRVAQEMVPNFSAQNLDTFKISPFKKFNHYKDDELTKLEIEKMKLLQEKINAKKKIKECETMMEKRNRRLRKKAEKERKRQERIGHDKDMLGYTNEDNPFGDEKLLDTFVWRKKMDRDGKTHLTETEQRRMIQSKQSLNTKVRFLYNCNSLIFRYACFQPKCFRS